MKAVFVTGTDTGTGKTLVTGCLARYLAERGYNVITQKWIQTGCGSFSSSDIKAHLEMMGPNGFKAKEYLAHTSPYVFKKPCSPHLAAKLENKRIDIRRIKRGFRLLSREFDFVIVEGTGGALVPFSKSRLIIDIAKELRLPALLVAGNKLGAINHTLLTIEALRMRKIRILGVVFNDLNKEEEFILEDNPRIIKRFSGEKVFGALPRIKDYNKLYKEFIPIAQRIDKWITGSRRI